MYVERVNNSIVVYVCCLVVGIFVFMGIVMGVIFIELGMLIMLCLWRLVYFRGEKGKIEKI